MSEDFWIGVIVGVTVMVVLVFVFLRFPPRGLRP